MSYTIQIIYRYDCNSVERLVAVREAAHARHHAENVVVRREDVDRG